MVERRLFSVGDLNVDVLQALGHAPVFGEEHLLKELVFSIGGCAANFSVIAAKLGLKPALVSILGKDFGTPFLEKGLSDAGVEKILLKSGKPNSFSVILVKPSGERAILSIKNCFEDVSSQKFAGPLLSRAKRADIVCFGGFYNLEKLRPGFEKMLSALKKKGAVVCFDTSFDPNGTWNIDRFLPFIDFLFVNDVELQHIAKGGNAEQRAKNLFAKGCNAVVLKQGSKGASLFVKGFPSQHFPAIKVKAVDTTGAGDSFNAGFAFGLMNGYGLGNCMRSALFVAAHKIQVHGLAAPSKAAVGRYISLNNKPTLVKVKNHGELGKIAARRVINLLKRKPNASFLLPTGETPKQMYKLLANACKKREADFGRASFFALDEYAGLRQNDKNSFSHFLMENFLGKVNAKKGNIHLLNGAASNLRAECAKHEAAIRKNGIDLCILGIGRNGHVAFNEPGSCSYGITRPVVLKPGTRRVNGKGFPKKLAPQKALTVGLRTIRENSAKILLLASGRHKCNAVSALMQSKDFLQWPAVALKPHKNFMVIVDRAAAGKVKGA